MITTTSATEPVDIKALQSFAEFYPYLPGRAQQPHLPPPALCGQQPGTSVPATMFVTGNPLWLLAGLLCGYGIRLGGALRL
jgi:hypothetical protein